MKVLPFKIPKPDNKGLVYQVDKAPVFYDKLHQHKEIQISLILSGEGDIVVGDTIGRYAPGDIFVIDGNMPHLLKSDPIDQQESHMLTLFFTKSSFGSQFFDLEEVKEVAAFFRKIESGLRLMSNKDVLEDLFLRLDQASTLERFITLLKVLKIIVNSESEHLSSFVYRRSYTEDEGVRMSKVMNHAMTEFGRDISLDEIAAIANMTPNAFCRYFKQRTNKTFIQFLTEIRIEQACRLLLKEKEMTIAQVSDLSGFKNMSNFNRKFKDYKGLTPTSFRKSVNSIA